MTSSTTGARADPDLAHRPIPGGAHRDRFGCEVPNVAAPSFTAAPVREQHDLRKAIAEYRAAAALPRPEGSQPSYHDLVTRLPLSVALYRAHRIAEARAQWRTMLADRIADAKRYQMQLPPQPPAADLLAQRRLDLLAERAEPDWWPGFFDTGAGQHMVRGSDAAQRGRVAAAAFEWRCAVRASPEFQPAHLMLGYVAALRGDTAAAKNEWIAALEGVQYGPGDMFAITKWQYDAMAALLRYTG